jgi:transcriptional antiterminator NusG
MPDELEQTKDPIQEPSQDPGDAKVGSSEETASVPSEKSGESVVTGAEAGKESNPKKEKRSHRKKDSEQKQDASKGGVDTSRMGWYIVKVQTNREDSACEALTRRIKVAGMDQHFGEIIVPVERVTEVKGGKKRIVRRKLYPGYIVVQMELNDDTWFLVRETPGIGDFTGAIGRPTPLLPHEVNRILTKLAEEKAEDAPKLKIGCRVGDRVKINEGHFANFQGEVSSIDEANGRVTVMINIFGRSTPVELEYWQVEPAE